ncbi:MAG: cyclic nucleotide-binding domain-containing protein [Anaerolineae bacterium]|nr:cyclic nucleotide-binding domain-containing protein [Anaerolineae bacterium]
MTNKLIIYLKKLIPSKTATPAVDPKTIRYLKRQPFFRHTPEPVLAHIATRIKERSLAKGDILLHEGDPSESLFIIRTGWVKVVAAGAAGEEVVLNQHGPGQVIGEMSLIDQKPRSHTMVALRPVEALEIEYDVVLDVLDHYPVLGRSLLQEMFERARFANAYIEESIEWCRRIAAGDYDFVQEQVEQTQSTIVGMDHSDQARASAFLSVFFKMAEDVKKREDDLKRQVQQLTIEIDEVKRKKKVQELTETQFFEDLLATVQEIRQRRRAKEEAEGQDSEEFRPGQI